MCGFGVQTQTHLEANRSIYPVGCADKAVMWMESHLLLVGALALGLALPQVRRPSAPPAQPIPTLIGCDPVTSAATPRSPQVSSYFRSRPAADASVGCSRARGAIDVSTRSGSVKHAVFGPDLRNTAEKTVGQSEVCTSKDTDRWCSYFP